jgi:hypothetical protein
MRIRDFIADLIGVICLFGLCYCVLFFGYIFGG